MVKATMPFHIELSDQDLAWLALDEVMRRKAAYADIRLIELRDRIISTKNGTTSTASDSTSMGLGIRINIDGGWGFSATDHLTKEGIMMACSRAIDLGRASALIKADPINLALQESIQASWTTPTEKDPFSIPIEKQLELLLEIDTALRGQKGITLAEAQMHFSKEKKLFLSSEGSCIYQTLISSGAGYSASAYHDGQLQKRSYPNSFGGQYQRKGYELIDELKLLENAPRIAEEAIMLLRAPACPAGEKTLILDSSQLGLQIHESVGHPIELDRVLGSEANYAGSSFLDTDKLHHFQYGSSLMNIVADATQAHGPGLGTFGFDDEGVPSQQVDIVKNGEFVGYLSSRETAPLIGLNKSGASMRAESWNRIPLIRMTNISLLPGQWALDDLIADTHDGIYMETNRSWSIDDKRYHFQFGTELAWEIKNGKKTRLLKNPIYEGITPVFWNSLDAICSRKYWTLWGTPNCGKGQPCQVMGTGHGASPARFQQVKVRASHE
ncbi:MAG: TldD/PmbA family protein [Chlamydiota bacterium]|nr:TldD/PmbA family protein [Chlamydiota bacterium]